MPACKNKLKVHSQQGLLAPSTATVVAVLSHLSEGKPERGKAAGIDLVVVRRGPRVFVLFGLCPHRRAHMADGCLEGESLVCASHGWDFDLETGESRSLPGQKLKRFETWTDEEQDTVLVDERALVAWRQSNPDSFRDGECLGS